MLFTYKNGGNPYITITNTKTFELLTKYEVEQVGETHFFVTGEKESPKGYRAKQEALREIAVNWQMDFENFAYSWGELAKWGDFFTEMGKKYGLLREFRENAIPVWR